MCIANYYLAGTIVQTTISMQSMLAKARGSGSMPLGNFENCYALRWYFEQTLHYNVIIYLEHFITDILLKLACSQLYKK